MIFFSSVGLNLADLAIREAKKLNLKNIKNEGGGISFEGDFIDAMRYCIYSRISVRLMLRLNKTDEELDSTSLKEWISKYQFENYFTPDSTFCVTSSLINTSYIKNSMLCSQVVKDGICDRQRKIFNNRSNIDKDNPDFTIHIFLSNKSTILYLDFSGQSLNKRHYRVVNTPVYLQEHTSFAVFKRSVLENCPDYIVDPFVGSGTILIEAALYYTDTAPGLIDTQRYAFLKYKDFNKKEYDKIVNEAINERKKKIEQIKLKYGNKPFLFGFDSSKDMINAAIENAKKAGVIDFISFSNKRIQDIKLDDLPKKFTLITDPPYSIREKIDDIKSLYIDFNSFIEKYCKGNNVSILTPLNENLSFINLKPSRVNTIMNGQIKCSLNNYYVLSDEERESIVNKKNQKLLDMISRPLSLEAQSFYNRLLKNQKKLNPFLKKNNITCYRLYDGDIRQYSSIVDVYDKWVVLYEYEKGKFVDSSDADRRLEDMKLCVLKALKISPENLYVKLRKRMKGFEQYEKKDNKKENFIVNENGLRFFVNFDNYLDTYLFLDHRSIRSYIREKSYNKRFLNLFAYTGSATVNAKKGGALSTISVDTNSNYLNIAQENLKINKLLSLSDFFIKNDVLTFLNGLHDNDIFDLIFVDPPTFSNGKGRDCFDVQKCHEDLIHKCMRHLSKDGELIFSNNYKGFEMSDSINNIFDVKDITPDTIDEDFENSKIHKVYIIKHKKNREERKISVIVQEILNSVK